MHRRGFLGGVVGGLLSLCGFKVESVAAVPRLRTATEAVEERLKPFRKHILAGDSRVTSISCRGNKTKTSMSLFLRLSPDVNQSALLEALKEPIRENVEISKAQGPHRFVVKHTSLENLFSDVEVWWIADLVKVESEAISVPGSSLEPWGVSPREVDCGDGWGLMVPFSMKNFGTTRKVE